MTNQPACPKCNYEFTYDDGVMFICPECANEWSMHLEESGSDDHTFIVRDSNGNILSNGDSITIIKDLKVKGSSSSLKIGTKVKNIKLIDSDHNIECKIDGFGEMKLKSEFVKKL